MPMRMILCVTCFLMLFAGTPASIPPAYAEEHIDPLKEKPLRIDFNDVVNDGEEDSILDQYAELRIAVAAMISPRYTYEYYLDLLNLIGDLLGRKVKFIQKKTYAEVNLLLKRNELDLAFVCSGPYVMGKAQFGLEIIAVPLCHGEKVYYSYFIASKANQIKSFDDLRGKTFAFTDPLSNTGYVVPNYYLAQKNETPEHFFKHTFFTFSHDNSIQAVANGLADGAAVDSLIYNFMRAKQPEFTALTTIIDKSPPYGIPPIVVSPEMDSNFKSELKEMFLSIHENPKGKPILASLQIDRFVEGDDDDYDTVREMQAFLENCESKNSLK